MYLSVSCCSTSTYKISTLPPATIPAVCVPKPAPVLPAAILLEPLVAVQVCPLYTVVSLISSITCFQDLENRLVHLHQKLKLVLCSKTIYHNTCCVGTAVTVSPRRSIILNSVALEAAPAVCQRNL